MRITVRPVHQAAEIISLIHSTNSHTIADGDREGGKFGPINLRRATWYGHAHKIVEEWAEQWVKISNAELGDEIDDTRTWTLMPW